MPIQNSPYADTGSNVRRGLDNIAQLFAPPSAGDLAGYADAGLKNQRRDIIEKLRSDPRYAGADAGVLADLFDPTSSWKALDMDDATKRYGIDTTASTSRLNNAADNTRQFATEMFQPLSQGQIRPEVPTDIGSLFGVSTPLPQVAGAAKPLTEGEVQGGLLERAIAENLITPQDAANKEKSSINVEQIDANGAPKIVSRSDAIGQQAYVNKGAEAKPENMVAVLPDGKTQVPALQGPDGGWYNAQTKARLPDDIRIFKVPQAQGTAADIGLSKPTDTYIEKQLIDIAIAKDTATKLRDLIQSAPASQGLVGWLRGTAQNVVQTGGELGTFFGGQVAEVAKDIESGLADADLAGAFDPNIPAIDMMSNLLAFQYAKTTTGERLSNEMLRAAKAALGLDGLDANQANSLARLNQAILLIQAQQDMLNSVRNEGIDATNTPAPAAGPTAAMPSAPSDAPAGWDPEDWKYLNEDEKAQVLNGG
jgi:hypothetical protein